MHRRVRIFRCGLALLALLCSVSASQAATHTLISGGVSGEDYAQSVFRRLGEVWVAPQGLHGDFRTEIVLSIDSSGMLSDCRVVRPSGLEALDSSTCGAAYKIGRFAPPPDGQPIDLVCSFQIQKTQAEEDDPDKALMEEVRAHARRQTEYRTREAGYAEEDARARAEAAARERGETFAGYDFVPGQDIPDAPTLLQRTPTVVVAPSPQDQKKAAAGKGEVSAEGNKAQPVVPGHIISRYPPVPGAHELVVDPHAKRPAAQVAPALAQTGKGAQATAHEPPHDTARGGKNSAASGRDRQPQAETEAQPVSKYVLPQPPLPPKGVQGQVIEPGKPAAERPVSAKPAKDQQSAAESQADVSGAGQAKARAGKIAQSAAEAGAQPAPKYVLPQPPLPSKGVRGRVIEPGKPAAERPVSAKLAKDQQPAAESQADVSGAGQAKARAGKSAQSAAETGAQPAPKYVLPQPPLPPKGVKGQVIDPAAPVAPLPVTPRPAVREQKDAAGAVQEKAAAVSEGGTLAREPEARR